MDIDRFLVFWYRYVYAVVSMEDFMVNTEWRRKIDFKKLAKWIKNIKTYV